MTSGDVTIALSSLLSITGIWLLLFWLYRDYCVDKFRQEMFALRDELFDLGRAGTVSYSHPAYGLLRSTMNGFIRFGHRFTLLHALAITLIARERVDEKAEDSFPARWEKSTRDLSPEALEVLRRYRMRMHVLVLKHVLRSSPILVASIVAPLAGWVALRLCLGELLRIFRSPLDGIDSAALAEGQA